MNIIESFRLWQDNIAVLNYTTIIDLFSISLTWKVDVKKLLR